MRRPWQIWLGYFLCLAVVLPAMGWLTHQTLEADRAEWQARLAAEREEAIGSVLWQMDTELTTLLAQEATRPHFVYSPFYTAPAVVLESRERNETREEASSPGAGLDWVAQQLPSPLLTQPSPYVLLHFQLAPDGNLTSPQAPTGLQCQAAIDNGTPLQSIQNSNARLAALGGDLSYERVVALLPSERLPQVGIGQWQVSAGLVAQKPAQIVGNTLDYGFVQDELQEQTTEGSDVELARGQSIVPIRSRRGGDLQDRNRAYQQAAQRQAIEQRLNYNSGPAQLRYVSEGVSQPIWLGKHLLLARRVKVGEDEVVQGCWLDWPKIRNELIDRYDELLPGIALEPVQRDMDRQQIKVSRLLATLPAQLVVPEYPPVAQPFSPLKGALVVAWGMLALAALAVAILLQGVITLSERRGAFVSAVTHELRTPLTTFRMYAEMLAENMVPTAEHRQKYLDTLRVEADRLSHLVENVLAYARLERGRHARRREPTSLAAIVEHLHDRLQERADQAEMKLVVQASDRTTIQTDPAAVEQILFNLVDNACKYAAAAAQRQIELQVSATARHAVLRVRDHGPGIDTRAARRLFRPFSKSVHDAACSAPGVGLGLALSRRLAQQLGGRLVLETTDGLGATFALYLPIA